MCSAQRMKRKNGGGGERIAFATSQFSVVVCRHPDGRYLAVNESKNRGWWLPAGHVDRGQNFIEAAYRETLEEAGINIVLKDCACRMRVIFYAEPCDPNQPPKHIPDEESNGAVWMTLDEIEQKKSLCPPEGLRGEELLRWGRYLEDGGFIAPMIVKADGTYEGFFRIEDSGPLVRNDTPVPFTVQTSIHDVNLPGHKNWTQLHHAVSQNDVAKVRALLLDGADPNRTTHKGRTSLHFASTRGNLEIVRLLLIAGADPLLVDFEGKTAEDVVANCVEKPIMLHLMNMSRISRCSFASNL